MRLEDCDVDGIEAISMAPSLTRNHYRGMAGCLTKRLRKRVHNSHPIHLSLLLQIL